MTQPRFQTRTEIQSLLDDAGVRPKRRYGQNFLIDANLMNRLLAAAELTSDDAVLEVGSGTGSLTEQLLRQAGIVIAVEIDPVLHTILQARLGTPGKFKLIRGDVLRTKHRITQSVSDALARARRTLGGRMMLVANLPYNIATPLLANLLLEPCGFDRFCFTVQREVGDRLVAAPGTKNYGPISIALQCTCRLERLALLPPQVFWPRPKVESVMLKADVVPNAFDSSEQLARFMGLLRSGFAHRRKTLRYNLGRTASEEARRLMADKFDLSRRPETLSIVEWVSLARHAGVLNTAVVAQKGCPPGLVTDP